METRAFNEVNNYLGWGDPTKGLWFIGLEEAASWGEDSETEIFQYYKGRAYSAETEWNWAELGHGGKKIRDYTCKIVKPFSEEYKQLPWQQYRDEVLWKEGRSGPHS